MCGVFLSKRLKLKENACDVYEGRCTISSLELRLVYLNWTNFTLLSFYTFVFSCYRKAHQNLYHRVNFYKSSLTMYLFNIVDVNILYYITRPKLDKLDLNKTRNNIHLYMYNFLSNLLCSCSTSQAVFSLQSCVLKKKFICIGPLFFPCQNPAILLCWLLIIVVSI